MKRTLLLLVFFFFASHSVFAQYDYEDEDLKKKKPELKQKKENPDRKFDPSKLSVGGFFGMSFGDVIYVDVSPVAVYRFHKRFALGAGFNYQFMSYKNYPSPYNKSSIYGGRLFPRVFIWEELFAQLEYEILNGEVTYIDYSGNPVKEVRETFHTGFIGAGYNIPLGENSYFTIMVSTNINKNLVYQNPFKYFFFDVGFGIGL